MIEDIQVKVSGGTPIADSSEYVLFDSTLCFGGGLMAVKGIDRAQFNPDNPAAGSLKSYSSPDKGVTWYLNSVTAVAPNASVITSGQAVPPYDFGLSGFVDWKLAWLNGGTAQTGWQPTLTLTRGQKVVG